MAAQVRIGCSGWSYPHWRKRFYPEKLPAREQFAFYARHFDTVELNNSFYRQPPPERSVAWRGQSPPGFLFAVKGSRYVTHVKRLVVGQKSIDLVVDSARELGDRLGPILFQLQANFRADVDRLRRFLGMLPADVRFALEFRHDSWLVPPVLDLLRSQRIAMCIPDHPKLPKSLEITSDFTYVRMHMPPRGLGYGERALQPWADRVIGWRRAGLNVIVYFNNDLEGHAVRDAKTLMSLVTMKGIEP
jgi:uncharacterized protein YecE (DUF72 family)